MLADGVLLEKRKDGASRLVTADPALAAKYGMVDETEFLED